MTIKNRKQLKFVNANILHRKKNTYKAKILSFPPSKAFDHNFFHSKII